MSTTQYINGFRQSKLKAFFLPLLGNSAAFPNCLHSGHDDVDTADAKYTWMVLDVEPQ
jgi:hypothetical protein